MSEFVFLWILVSLVNLSVFAWLAEQTQVATWAFLFFCWLSVFVPPVACFAALVVYRDITKTGHAIHDEYKKGSMYLENFL